jgi:hypothetical protein
MWGQRFLWIWMTAIIVCGAVSFHTQAPLAAYHCPLNRGNAANEATPENCATIYILFSRSVSDLWEGSENFIDYYHEHIAALATVVIAIYTVVLGIATIRLWRSADNQLAEFRRSLNIAEEHAGHMASSVTEAARAATAMEGVAGSMAENVERLRETVEINRGIGNRQKTFGEMQMRAYISVLAGSLSDQASPSRGAEHWTHTSTRSVVCRKGRSEAVSYGA